MRIPSTLRATPGSLSGVVRDGVADVWRRMPSGMRRGTGWLNRFNQAVLRAGGPPVARTRMGAGHHLLLDLRSGSEWLAFYTGAFDDGRVAAAQALLQRPGATVVDAGANVGFWTVPLATCVARSGGRVIAIEPVPANAARLRENLRLNAAQHAATIHELAVSDAAGEVSITLREDFTGGARTGNAAVVIPDGTDDRFATVRSETITLDDLLAQHERPKIDLIKADLEGHEDLFLAGATETVTRDRPVAFVEWNRIYYERRGIDPTAAVFPLLRAWDYRCLRVDAHGWSSSRSFTSPRPLDDLVLAPAERLGEVREVLESQAAP